MYEIIELCPNCGISIRMKMDITQSKGAFTCPSCKKTAEYFMAFALIWDDEVTWN